MRNRRTASLLMALVMLMASLFGNIIQAAESGGDGTGGIGVIQKLSINLTPYMESAYYSDQPISLKIESPPATIISFAGDAEKVYFAQTMVVWENPDNGQTYYGYCVNPKYAGWKSSDPYNIDIGEFSDDSIVDKGGSGGSGKRAGDTVAGGASNGWNTKIKDALEGAIVAGFPSHTAEELLGHDAVYYGVSQDHIEYAAYVATKMAIWTLIHDAYVDISDWEGHPTADYPQALINDMLQVFKDIVNAGRYYTPQPSVPITLTHSKPVKNGANWEVTYTVEGNPLKGTEILVGYENDMAFNNGEKILLMSGTEAQKGTGGYSARYILPAGEKQFKAVFPIPSPPYSETRNIQIFAQTGNKQLLYAEALKSSRQNLVLAGNAYARVIEPYTVEEDKPGNPPDDPSGDLVIYKLDAVTGTALSGVAFDVYNSKGQRVSSGTTGAGGTYKPNIRDESGKLIKNTYWIIERTTNTGYQYTEPLTQSIKVDEENVTYTVTFRDFPSQTVTIIKEDAQTGAPVNGCEYEIMQIDGKGAWRAVATTAGKGEAKWDNVPDGTYLVREVSTISGYILDPTPQYVTVRNGQAPSLKFLDSKYPGLSIMKMDKLTGSVIANQATFHVEQIDGAYTTDINTSSGVANLKDLPIGSYKITEGAAPEGYVATTDYETVYLGEGESKQVMFYNLPCPLLTIEKIDAQTGDPIPGTKFEIKKTDGTLIGTVETGSDGTVIVGRGGIANPIGYFELGIYTVTEVFVPAPYVLTGEHQDITLNAGDRKTLFFGNLEMPKIQIEKYDEKTVEMLPNAQFAIYEQHDLSRPVVEGVTDKNGVLNSGYIKPGTYVISELNPPPGYMFSDKTPQTRTIVANAGDGVIVVKFDNIMLPQLTIKKVDAVTGEPIQGVTYRVERTDDTSFQPATVITNAKGIITIPGLEAGTYIITEISCPSRYILSSKAQNVKMEGGDEKTVLFENTLYPTLVIEKINYVTFKPVENTTFKIERENTTGGIELIGTYRTDANGRIVLPYVNPGWYIATETIPAQGMSLPSNPVTRIYLALGTNSYTDTTNGNIGGNGSFSVMSGSDYPVVAGIPNYELNSIVVKKTDAVTKELLPGATFELIRITGETSGQNGQTIGTFVIDPCGVSVITGLEPGGYAVREISPPDNYTLSENTLQTGFLKADGTSILEFTFANFPYGTLLVSKVDAKTGAALPNARFEVKDSDGLVVGTANGIYTTDINGEFIIPNLDPKSYVVTEIQAPDGYAKDPTPQTINVKHDGNIYKLTFENEPLGTLVILKKDAATREPLANAEFKVTTAKGTVAGTGNGIYKTDANGSITIPNLDKDTYLIEEIKAPDGFLLENKSQTIAVEYGKTHTVEFTNKRLSSLQVVKIDAANKRPLKDAQFKIYKMNGELLGTYYTDADGLIILDNLDTGWYKAVESRAPLGYQLDDTAQDFQIIANQFVKLTFENKKLTSLIIKKTDDKSGEPLAGAVFVVERQNGEYVGEYSTDSDGTINIPTLDPDWYIVREKRAPDGYKLDESPKTVQVKTDVPTVVTFTNKKLTSLQIKKVDAVTGAPLAGAVFTVERQNGEAVYTLSNGTEFVTDGQGLITIPTLTPDYYVVREIKAPENYIIDSTPKTVEVKTDAPTTVTFSNQALAGLKIIKLNSATRQPIAGVEFTVMKMSGEKVNNDFNGTTFKTDATGQIYIPNLENGYYNVTETRAADGYMLDAEPKNVLVQSGKQSVLEVLNTPMSGLLIVKTDEKTGKPLAGAVFDVRRADGQFVAGYIADGNQPNTEANSPNKTTSPNGDITGSYTTDRNGRIQINTLPAGEYHVTERKALEGYMLDTDVHSATVTPGKLTTLQLTNTPKAGLRVIKIDSITKKPIYNVEFMVFDANNKVVGTYYTDNQGVIDFAGILTEGRYTIRETRAAKGYYLDEIPKTVEFVSGKVTEIRWENTPQMAQIQILKKSGDDNEVNGLPAGTPLANATFEAYDYKTGNLADRFVSGSDGRAVSAPLPLGRYIIKEVKAPQWYKLSDKTLDVELEFATQIVKLEYLNYAANTGVTIRKTGPAECMPGDTISYAIRTVQNTGTTPLTDFYWRDNISTDAVRLSKIVTGSYNQALKYKILANTNKGDTRVIADNLTTTRNNVIDCSNAALGLKNDEYVTSFTLVFGTVKAGFAQVEQPQIFAKVLSSLPNQYQFANKVDVGGKYGSEWIAGNSTTLCTTYKKPEKLPRTGY